MCYEKHSLLLTPAVACSSIFSYSAVTFNKVIQTGLGIITPTHTHINKSALYNSDVNKVR